MIVWGVLVIGLLLGMMLFFGLVLAPTVFAKLPAETAGCLIRSLFPHYYAIGFGLAIVGGLLVAPRPAAGLLFLTAIAFVLARQMLMPKINAARDAGETARFERLHRLSVIVNGVQIVALMAAVFFLAATGVAHQAP